MRREAKTLQGLNSTTIESFFDDVKPAEILFKAIATYNDLSGMFNPSTFKVLMKLLTMANYEDFREPVIVSLPKLERHLRLDRKTILTGLKELMAKKFIIQVSGKYEKDIAYYLKGRKFLDTNRTRSYNEVNAYIVDPAIEIGYFIYLWKKTAKAYNLSVDIIREFVLLISAVQDKLLPLKPSHTSVKALKEKLPECPTFFEALTRTLENSKSVQQLKTFLRKVKLADKEIREFFRNLKLDDKNAVELFLNQIVEIFHNQIGEIFPIYSLPINPLPLDTHTQAQPKKTVCQDLVMVQTTEEPLRLDNKNQQSGKQEKEGEKRLDLNQSEETIFLKKKKPKKEKKALDIPYEVVSFLTEYLKSKDDIRNPIGVIKTASETDLNLLAEEILKRKFKGDFEIEILLKDYKLEPLKVLEYAILTEEGKLDFLEKHNINVDEFSNKVWKAEEKYHEEIKNHILENIETKTHIKIEKPIYEDVLKELEQEGKIKIIQKGKDFWHIEKVKSEIDKKIEVFVWEHFKDKTYREQTLIEKNALLIYSLIEKYRNKLDQVVEEIRNLISKDNTGLLRLTWNTLKAKGILRGDKKENKIEMVFPD